MKHGQQRLLALLIGPPDRGRMPDAMVDRYAGSPTSANGAPATRLTFVSTYRRAMASTCGNMIRRRAVSHG